MYGLKINGKRAYGQAGFRKYHSTIDHLVTFRVLMEESLLRGEGLYCCFVLGNISLRMEDTENRSIPEPVPIGPDRLGRTHM